MTTKRSPITVPDLGSGEGWVPCEVATAGHRHMRAICLLVVISIAPHAAGLAVSPSRAISRPRIGARPIVAQFGGSKVPSAVAELIDPAVEISDVAPLWKQFRSCYPSEQQAVEAARRNTAVILPFINTADNIRFNRMILRDEIGFTDAEVLDIITRNPGILGNQPGQQARASKSEVLFSLQTVGLFDAIPAPVRAVIPALTAVSIVAVIAKRLLDCAGGICG